MNLRQSLASAFATRYPSEAAASLEARPVEEIARVLRGLTPATAAIVLRRLSPGIAARSVEQLDAETAARVLSGLEVSDTLPLLRRVAPSARERVIASMPAERANALKAVIGFPPGTAGALMDPRVAALPADTQVDKALQAVRADAEHAHHHLYIVDREGRLAGLISLQQLLSASPKDRLAAIMQQASHRLPPGADRHAIVGHRGWRETHSLPVVDGDDRLLGAIHYRVLRALEDEIHATDAVAGESTAQALGDLFWAGVGGFINAFASTAAPLPGRLAPRPSMPSTSDGQPNGADVRRERRRGEEVDNG
jgi:magnesium transporter